MVLNVSCRSGDNEWAIVHACKSPCHQNAVGYSGSLKNTHPNYLVLEKETDLFLNMIDPPIPLFMLPLFTSFLRFADNNWRAGKKLLIHCNQGESRALLWVFFSYPNAKLRFRMNLMKKHGQIFSVYIIYTIQGKAFRFT